MAEAIVRIGVPCNAQLGATAFAGVLCATDMEVAYIESSLSLSGHMRGAIPMSRSQRARGTEGLNSGLLEVPSRMKYRLVMNGHKTQITMLAPLDLPKNEMAFV